MSVSSLLEILRLSETMTQKATAANTAIQSIERAVADKLVQSTAEAASPGFNLVLPFDDANDLSDRTALRFIFLELAAGATADFNVIHPDNKHLFFAKNGTAFSATVKTLNGTGIVLSPNGFEILYCDGVNVISVNPSSQAILFPYDIFVNVFGTPQNGEVLASLLTSREITIPQNMIGSIGSVGTNPNNNQVYSVKVDGVEIGTISVNTSGVFSFATSGGTEKIIPAGSSLTVVAPATTDIVISDIRITIQATVT